MTMNIKLLPPNKTNLIYINPDSIKDIPNDIVINFGSWKKEVNVQLDRDLPEDTIGIPENLTKNFSIPTNIPYEVYLCENNLYIGPVIAFIYTRHKKSITLNSLHKLRDRFMNYKSINGLIFVCTQNMINTRNKTIGGYYYNPNSEDDNSRWLPGTFPYPGVIFRRGYFRLSKKKYKDIYETIGDKIFNTPGHINKWRLWSILSKYRSIRNHLPYTCKLTGIDSLDHIITLYGSAYLKPYNLSSGIGIIKVHRSWDGYHFIDTSQHETLIENREDAEDYLFELTRGLQYIIQQPVPFKFEGRNVDFRVYLQKNYKKQWSCSGITTKVSKMGSIITNYKNREYLITSDEAFKRIYNLDDEAALSVKSKIISLCTKACSMVEKHGEHLGDVALDVIVDNNLKPWLLEIQVNYACEKRSSELPEEIYQKIVTTPFEYAKALADF